MQLTAVGAAGAALTAAGGKANFTTESLEAHELTLPVSGLPPALSGARIGFLTDLHYGPATSERWIREIFETTAQQKLDLTLLGGDYPWVPESTVAHLLLPERNKFFHHLSRRELPDAIFSRFEEHLSALTPAAGVFGNHDRWIARELTEDAFRKAGAELLVNEWIEYSIRGETIAVYGFDDFWTGFPKLPSSAPSKKSALRIGVTHNPDLLRSILSGSPDDFDLILCGHTHGGQICLPGRLPLLTNIRDTRFSTGLRRMGNTLVYTSRGLGVVEIPYRINCPAELPIFRLEPKAIQ